MAWGHSDEKPYSCTYCDKKFKGRESWKRHEKTHTGEKTYSCPLCGKKFMWAVELTRHKNKNNCNLVTRPYTKRHEKFAIPVAS